MYKHQKKRKENPMGGGLLFCCSWTFVSVLMPRLGLMVSTQTACGLKGDAALGH